MVSGADKNTWNEMHACADEAGETRLDLGRVPTQQPNILLPGYEREATASEATYQCPHSEALHIEHEHALHDGLVLERREKSPEMLGSMHDGVCGVSVLLQQAHVQRA
jgi:hypothetical protein